jgi:D-aminopeptidase
LVDRGAVRPSRLDGPVAPEVDVLHPGMTERAQLAPGMQLAGDRTLAYRAESFAVAYGLAQLIAALGAL